MQIASYIPSRIVYDLQALEQVDYHQGITAFMEGFSECFKGKAAIYQFGEVRAPGISDLDLLLVVEDAEWREAEACARKASQCTSRLAYLFVHPPLVVCDSLVESLPYLHTLENLQLLTPGWNPLENTNPQNVDKHSKLMRHAVWNSFMRMVALEMDKKTIGLRRALTLTHNLFLTAAYSNHQFGQHAELNLDSPRMYQQILQAPAEQRETHLQRHIQEVVDALYEVDTRLDEQLALRDDFGKMRKWVVSLRGRFVLPIQAECMLRECRSPRFMQVALLVFVPAYLLALCSLLAHRTEKSFHEMAAFRRLPYPKSLAQHFPPTAFETHFFKAWQLSQKHQVPFPFVLPFAYRKPKTSLKKRCAEELRLLYIRKLLSSRLTDAKKVSVRRKTRHV